MYSLRYLRSTTLVCKDKVIRHQSLWQNSISLDHKKAIGLRGQKTSLYFPLTSDFFQDFNSFNNFTFVLNKIGLRSMVIYSISYRLLSFRARILNRGSWAQVLKLEVPGPKYYNSFLRQYYFMVYIYIYYILDIQYS